MSLAKDNFNRLVDVLLIEQLLDNSPSDMCMWLRENSITMFAEQVFRNS